MLHSKLIMVAVQEHSGAMEKLLTAACAQPGRPKPVLALVGATVPESLAELAVQMVGL